MRIALATPFDPGLDSNGASHRARFWRRTLASMGELTTYVIPVSSPPPVDDDEPELGDLVVVEPMLVDNPDLPIGAQLASEFLGIECAHRATPFDLIVGFRSVIGPFAIGLGAASSSCIVVDLDDDDVSFHQSRGEHDHARQHRTLIKSFTPRLDLLVSATGFGATVAVPNVPPCPIRPDVRTRSTEPRTVGMFGNFRYAPNVDGARWLLDSVWPLVERIAPDARLVIAGAGSELLDHGIGYVDDLDEFFDDVACTVAPIHTGSGTRIKILESWARGVPVVTTTIGADGLDALDDVNAMVADDAAAFALRIVALLDDPAIGRRLASEALDHVRSDFAAGSVADATLELLARAIERSTRHIGPAHAPDLDVAEVADGLSVFEPTELAAHHLNPSAAVVFMLCDGTTPEFEIADRYAETLQLDRTPLRMVIETIRALEHKRLLVR